jgi:hypothetical protein
MTSFVDTKYLNEQSSNACGKKNERNLKSEEKNQKKAF